MSTNVLDQFKLNGKTALITGGAGLYGQQITEALAQAGARTYMASRNLPQIQKLAEQYQQRGLDVTPLALDQADESSIEQLKNTLLKQAGGVDILINNAVLRPMDDWSSPASDFAKSMTVNATGIFMMTRTFGELMATQKSGSIINVGSIQGSVGPDLSLYEGLDWGSKVDYFFHKGGMLNLTRYAAAKLGPSGVRVNIISPGGFNDGQESVFVDRYVQRTMLGRMANKTDLQGAIVFLASDASAYVTGANLFIDGGYTAM